MELTTVKIGILLGPVRLTAAQQVIKSYNCRFVCNASKYCDVLKTYYEFVTSDCDASKDDGSCCTPSNPCALGQGDCDDDDDCAGYLVCGTDNCQSEFDSAWPGTATDCCTN